MNLLEAIGNIVKAISQIAKEIGLERESLCKIFSADSKPRFETIMRVLDSFGVKLQASA